MDRLWGDSVAIMSPNQTEDHAPQVMSILTPEPDPNLLHIVMRCHFHEGLSTTMHHDHLGTR